MSKRAPSLQDIADATGYSLMTVSRAIRGTGKVKEETAKKIFAKADAIGYTYNPEITRMMSMMRSGNRDRYHENIALLWFGDPQSIKKNPFLMRLYKGASNRAKALGYKVESFYFEDYELKANRVAQAIESRGIRGIILFPLVQKKELILSKLKMNWGKFAWVAFGNTHSNHEFHRVGHHHLFGMELAMNKLKAKGYKRPYLSVSSELDRTVHYAYTAGFLANHPLGFERALEYVDDQYMDWDCLLGNIKKLKADVLITNHAPTLVSHLSNQGIQFPEDLGCMSLHCVPSKSVSGVDQRNDVLGEYAIDMLVAQLHRKEVGLPLNPKLMLHKGTWHDGKTL